MLVSPLYFLLFLCSHLALALALALNNEGFALLNLRWSVQDDPEGFFSNWNSSDPTPCSWTGITCMANTVIAITIPKKDILGSIPPSLGSLSSLRHLNLRSNRLFGGLPRELFSANSLQTFVLYGNSLSGSLPPEVGNLSNLQVFDVSQNSLSGSVPVSLLNCKRLKSLDLGHNRFSGFLPSGIGSSLGELEKLHLSYNQFNGSIPGDLGDLSSLQGTLDFSHNSFSGPVPASLGNLPEKVYIDLTYNELTGPIPQYGALVNRGPTAFIGNPGLCGPPLKNPCSSDAPGTSPSQFSDFPADQRLPGTEVGGGRRALSRAAVIAIVLSDLFAIFGIALVFFCCYRRAISRGKGKSGNSDNGRKKCKECLCFVKGDSGTPSENAEQLDLILLDRHVNFDLDGLLKASAFVLGKSGIGIVYKVVLEDGLTLAVRRLGEGGSQRCKEFQMEAEVIGKVRHHNIVTLRAYYWSIDEKLLVYEYVPNGNLSAAIHDKNGMAKISPPTWLVRLKIMKGVARGLTYLHEFSPKKYVHGDLKPNNILLGHDMEPKISDFGLGRLANIAGSSPMVQSSRMATEKLQSHASDVAVSPVMGTGFYYQAPEALRTLKPSQKWDVYSYGVMLLELITGRSPIVLVGTSEMDLVKWVQLCIEEKKSLAEILDPCLVEEPEEDQMIAVLKVALACVQTNPEKRPSMRHVLEMLERLSIDA